MIQPEKISLLERTHTLAHEFAASVPEKLVTLKPNAVAFSVNEVVHHLVDVEKLWHVRFAQMMERDGIKLVAMDPDSLAKTERYNSRSITEGLSMWKTLRAKTLEMIRHMDEVVLSRSAEHPRYGAMGVSRALDIIANHDLQHLEQMKRTVSEVNTKQ